MAHRCHSEKKSKESARPIVAIDQNAFWRICFQDGDRTHLK